MKHLEESCNNNSLLQMAKKNEENRKEFEKWLQERQGTEKVTEGMEKDHEQRWKEKVTPGYLQKQIDNDDSIDQKATNSWLQLAFSSHVEGYLMAI